MKKLKMFFLDLEEAVVDQETRLIAAEENIQGSKILAKSQHRKN